MDFAHEIDAGLAVRGLEHTFVYQDLPAERAGLDARGEVER
jgi:hypothetical protein